MDVEKVVGAFSFKKFTGERLDNIEEYVKEYCSVHPNIDILVGTDSQNRGPKTLFSTIIAMYDRGDGDGHGHGAHCVFSRWSTPRYRRTQSNERLLKEVEESIATADRLRDAGVRVKYIDLDINPEPGTNHRNLSNDVYTAAKGWVEGSGYECRWKTLGPLVTTMADWVVKK